MRRGLSVGTAITFFQHPDSQPDKLSLWAAQPTPQQAVAKPTEADYQPVTTQTLRVDSLTPTDPHAAIFYHTYYKHAWYVFYLQNHLHRDEQSDNAHR